MCRAGDDGVASQVNQVKLHGVVANNQGGGRVVVADGVARDGGVTHVHAVNQDVNIGAVRCCGGGSFEHQVLVRGDVVTA